MTLSPIEKVKFVIGWLNFKESYRWTKDTPCVLCGKTAVGSHGGGSHYALGGFHCGRVACRASYINCKCFACMNPNNEFTSIRSAIESYKRT